MKRMFLNLTYETVLVQNLRKVWVEKELLGNEWLLCYENHYFQRKIVYSSSDKELLIKLGDEIKTAYVNGKKSVTIE